MDMIGRIRRLHTRDKKSVRAIARITGLSRNTVTKWLSEQIDTPPRGTSKNGAFLSRMVIDSCNAIGMVGFCFQAVWLSLCFWSLR